MNKRQLVDSETERKSLEWIDECDTYGIIFRRKCPVGWIWCFSGSRPEGQNSAESPNGRGYENKGQKSSCI